MNRSLITKDLLNIVVAIGLLPDKTKPPLIMGTGVLVDYDDLAIIVTTKHIIEKLSEFEDYYFFNNSIDGKIVLKSFQWIKNLVKRDWIYHSDPQIDLAINFFPFNPKIDLIKIIPRKLYAEQTEIEIGAEAYVLGYPYGIASTNSVIPIARRALIAGRSIEGHYFVDAAIFKGNSGGPIFLRPSVQRPDGSIVIGPTNVPKLIGFVKGIIETNEGQSLHLAQVIGIQKLIEIFSSSEFQNIIKNMKERMP